MPAPLRLPLWYRARRSRAARSSAAAVLVLATGLHVHGLLERAEEGARRYGHPVAVAVAARHLPAGVSVRPGDVVVRSLPASALPDDVAVRDPHGQVLAVPMRRGEVFVRSKLAAANLRGAAALVGPGERAVAVAAGLAGVPPLRVGDRVDVVLIDGTEPATLVGGAVVVAVDREAAVVTVAVPAGSVPGVAAAAAANALALALRGR